MAFITSLIVASCIAAAVGLAGSVSTQAMQNKSTRETNQANKELNIMNNSFNAEQAAINRDFQAEQAQIQRDYEERLSNSSVQRKVADLQAAGFNPALAVTSPSATTPGVSASSGSQANASGFIPMRAMDYSPMSQLQHTLSSAVHSANSIAYLDQMAKRNPQVINGLSAMTKAVNKTVTSADKMSRVSSTMKKVYNDPSLMKALNALGRG